MTDHVDLPNSELHEPKDIDTATADTIYLADGAGSGSWTDLPVDSVSGLNNANLVYIRASLSDLSTASIVYVPCPLAGTITGVMSILQGAITTTDPTLRLRILGTPVTDSDITIAQSGSAAGDVDTATPTAANTVTANSAIEVQNLGTGTEAEGAEILITVDVS